MKTVFVVLDVLEHGIREVPVKADEGGDVIAVWWTSALYGWAWLPRTVVFYTREEAVAAAEEIRKMAIDDLYERLDALRCMKF